MFWAHIKIASFKLGYYQLLSVTFKQAVIFITGFYLRFTHNIQKQSESKAVLTALALQLELAAIIREVQNNIQPTRKTRHE